MRTTHTFALLPLSESAFREIEKALRDAGYDHAFVDGAIDMHGIGVTLAERPAEPTPHRCGYDTCTTDNCETRRRWVANLSESTEPTPQEPTRDAAPIVGEGIVCAIHGSARNLCTSKCTYQPDTAPDVQAFWNAHAAWSRATFGEDHERGPIGPLKHLRKEVEEALSALHYMLNGGLTNRQNVNEEIVDCLFLVFDAARRSHMTLGTLLAECWRKLEINKAAQVAEADERRTCGACEMSDRHDEVIREAFEELHGLRPSGRSDAAPVAESALADSGNLAHAECCNRKRLAEETPQEPTCACGRKIAYPYPRRSCCDPCACVSGEALADQYHASLCREANSRPAAPPAVNVDELAREIVLDVTTWARNESARLGKEMRTAEAMERAKDSADATIDRTAARITRLLARAKEEAT